MSATVAQPQVKEHPILFSGSMVRAILEGRKTQTRRVITPQPKDSWMRSEVTDWSQYYKPARFGPKKHLWIMHPTENKEIVCPYGKPGDRLWVRETIRYSLEHTNFYYCADNQGVGNERFVRFIESRSDWTSHFRVRPTIPTIHMPRWASRITLEITNVRVERLQDISPRDAEAEGVTVDCRREHLTHDTACPVEAFEHGWDEINGKRQGCRWFENPWVWAINFKKLPSV